MPEIPQSPQSRRDIFQQRLRIRRITARLQDVEATLKRADAHVNRLLVDHRVLQKRVMAHEKIFKILLRNAERGALTAVELVALRAIRKALD